MSAIPRTVVAVTRLRWPVLDRSAASESVDAGACAGAADCAGETDCAGAAAGGDPADCDETTIVGDAETVGPELEVAASCCAVTAGGIGGWALGVRRGGAWVATATAHSVFG